MSRLRSENGLPSVNRRSSRRERDYTGNETAGGGDGQRQRLSKQEQCDFISSLIKNEHGRDDEEAVHQMAKKIFEYVASNTKYFSTKLFEGNLEKLITILREIQTEQLTTWKNNMYLAVQAHNLIQIKELVKINGFDLDMQLGPVPASDENQVHGAKEHTALTWAAHKGNLILLKSLIDQGANANAMTSDGLAPIHFAAMDSAAGLPALKYLVDNPKLKVDVNSVDSNRGVTPLMAACARGQLATAEYLLQQKAEINWQDAEGKTALCYAVQGGHINVIKLLIAHQACTHLKDESSASLLHYLMEANISWYAMREILDYLLEDLNLHWLVGCKETNGNTALHTALRRGMHIEAVQYLITRNADLLEAKKNGWETPLWALIRGKNATREMVQMMLNFGADFSVRNPLGMTLTQFASRCLKNQMLVGFLQEAQKELKSRRMKDMFNQRKRLLCDNGEGVDSESNKPVEPKVARKSPLRDVRDVENASKKPVESKLAKREPSSRLTPPVSVFSKVNKSKSSSSSSSRSSSSSNSSNNSCSSHSGSDESDNDDVNDGDDKKAKIIETTTTTVEKTKANVAFTPADNIIRRMSGIEDISSASSDDMAPAAAPQVASHQTPNSSSSTESDEDEPMPPASEAEKIKISGKVGKEGTGTERMLRPRQMRLNKESDKPEESDAQNNIKPQKKTIIYFSDSE